MTEREKPRAAIVGLGRIGSLLEDDTKREKPCTHAGAVASSGCCVLAAGADSNEERRRLFAERWKVPVYDSAEQMLAEEKPAILHIATHPDSHLFYCELAARYGVSVAVCEKPLADNLAKAKKIASLELSGKITILVNHERRYDAGYRKAKVLLDEEKLGRLLSIRAVLCMGKSRRLVDALWHDGTHLADAAMFLSGGILRHKKTWGSALSGREGTAFLAGFLEKKSPAASRPAQSTGFSSKARQIPFLLELGAERDHLVFELEFSCERGRLRIGNALFEVWESGESPYAENFRSLAKTGEICSGTSGYFSTMIQDAAACAIEKNKIPVSTALDGLSVIRYLNSIRPWIGRV